MLEPTPAASGNGVPRVRLRGLARVHRAAWAFSARRARGTALGFARLDVPPRAGDLVLARVDALGHHAALQLPSGRRKTLFVGDEIVIAYANRYAPSQFEAVVPQTLGPCQLVAGGGVAAKVLSWHARVTKGPTEITPIGLLVSRRGTIANLTDFALPRIEHVPPERPRAVAVVGAAMDSGKTQTAAFLVRGLTLAGLRVGYAKITGTGSGGDTWLLRDAGAQPVLDFTDAGLASTYCCAPSEIDRVLTTLMAQLVDADVDAIVLEIADGVLQQETAALLASPSFGEHVDGVLFAASDAMGALAGHAWLARHHLPVIALSGVMSASPLQCGEASGATGLPVFTRSDLARPRIAIEILTLAEHHHRTRLSGNGDRATPPKMSPTDRTVEAKPSNGARIHPTVATNGEPKSTLLREANL